MNFSLLSRSLLRSLEKNNHHVEEISREEGGRRTCGSQAEVSLFDFKKLEQRASLFLRSGIADNAEEKAHTSHLPKKEAFFSLKLLRLDTKSKMTKSRFLTTRTVNGKNQAVRRKYVPQLKYSGCVGRRHAAEKFRDNMQEHDRGRAWNQLAAAPTPNQPLTEELLERVAQQWQLEQRTQHCKVHHSPRSQTCFPIETEVCEVT